MYDPKIEKYSVGSFQKPRAVAFADFNFFGQSLLNKEFNKAIDVFDIIYCDGYWLYIILKSIGFNVVYKPGPIFFTEFVKNHTKFAILSKYSQLEIDTILGINSLNVVELPFVDNVEDFNFEELSKLIVSDDIFVSIGCPKQELFIDRIIQYLPRNATCYAIGAAVDFSLGKEKRAPSIIQWMRIEFLWRLMVSRRKQWKKWKSVPVVLSWFIKKLFLKILMRQQLF